MRYEPDLQDLSFRVERWDDQWLRPEALLAATTSVVSARAAFTVIAEANPGSNLMLRQGIREIAKRDRSRRPRKEP
ncbi:MAG: hypothetical protein ACTHJ3_19745 [Pararhizobium sp.]